MLDSGKEITFHQYPRMIQYGEEFPYYCEVTVTKDNKVGIHYNLYDIETRKLIYSGN